MAIHAEANALLHCDREDLFGATLYITREPCYLCSNLIRAAGVSRVVTPASVIQVDESAEAEAFDAALKRQREMIGQMLLYYR